MQFFLDDLPIGQVEDRWSDLLVRVLPTAHRDHAVIRWQPGSDDPSDRSAQIQAAALVLRDHGVLSGWRDERYCCEQPVAEPCLAFGAELFQLERAAFRFFGLMSRAVHVNGLRADGRVWCGRRAPHKAIDPGRLDSLAAGGLGAGEDILDCTRRELFEEAGVPPALSSALVARGAVRTRRAEPEGWHDEVLHVFDLLLPDDFEPANQDGEVSDSVLLALPALQARLGEFTEDAVAALRQSVLRPR